MFATVPSSPHVHRSASICFRNVHIHTQRKLLNKLSIVSRVQGSRLDVLYKYNIYIYSIQCNAITCIEHVFNSTLYTRLIILLYNNLYSVFMSVSVELNYWHAPYQSVYTRVPGYTIFTSPADVVITSYYYVLNKMKKR